MSRRDFLSTHPATLAAALLQWPYDPEPLPGADSAVNLTMRVTSNEWQIGFILSIIKEQGEAIRWLSQQILRTGEPWTQRPRRL